MEDDSCIIQLKNNVIIRILICMLVRSDYGCGMMSSIHFLPPPIRKATSSDKSRVGRPSGVFSRAALTEEC